MGFEELERSPSALQVGFTTYMEPSIQMEPCRRENDRMAI
jgi:hypothetical protein